MILCDLSVYNIPVTLLVVSRVSLLSREMDNDQNLDFICAARKMVFGFKWIGFRVVALCTL